MIGGEKVHRFDEVVWLRVARSNAAVVLDTAKIAHVLRPGFRTMCLMGTIAIALLTLCIPSRRAPDLHNVVICVRSKWYERHKDVA